jgi:hypothetical protein
MALERGRQGVMVSLASRVNRREERFLVASLLGMTIHAWIGLASGEVQVLFGRGDPSPSSEFVSRGAHPEPRAVE